MKKPKPSYKGIEFDSPEEREFFWWCEEAQSNGFLDSFSYHPETYKLTDKASIAIEKKMKTKTKTVDKFLFHPHNYTPDFIIYITPRFRVFDHGLFGTDNLTYYIDVKGGFSIYNNQREFSINQKLVWQKYRIFMNKVVPKELFKKTFCPGLAAITKTLKPRKHYCSMPTIHRALALDEIVTPPVKFIYSMPSEV